MVACVCVVSVSVCVFYFCIVQVFVYKPVCAASACVSAVRPCACAVRARTVLNKTYSPPTHIPQCTLVVMLECAALSRLYTCTCVRVWVVVMTRARVCVCVFVCQLFVFDCTRTVTGTRLSSAGRTTI